MQQFSILGEPDNYLKVTIDKEYGFPESTSPFGGYDTESLVEIKSSNYHVKGMLWVTTGNIYDFYLRLKTCHKDLSGKAQLESYEGNLKFTLEFNSFGHVFVSGEFMEKSMENNILKFEFTTDQTFISKTIDELHEIYNKYGANSGVKK